MNKLYRPLLALSSAICTAFSDSASNALVASTQRPIILVPVKIFGRQVTLTVQQQYSRVSYQRTSNAQTLPLSSAESYAFHANLGLKSLF